MIKSDGIAVGAACFLIIAAAAVGAWLLATGVRIEVYAPPLFGWLSPRLGPGTPAVIGLSVIAIVVARRFAAEQSWRRVMIIGYLAAVAWTVSLAMIDGWSGGLGSRLTNGHEYLHELGRIESLGVFLATFTDHILDFQPGSWVTHVAGHPPGVTALFWILDRLGLGGGDCAAVIIVLSGCLAAVAIPTVVSSLGAPEAARRIVPFTVFLPGALWVGVSADGLFAGVAAAGLALIVAGVRSRWAGWPIPVIAGGLLLGLVPYLSYGLILYGLVVAAAAGLTLRLDGRRVIGRWLVGTGAVALVAVIFTVAGFAWWEGLSLVHTRYYQGVAADRPYSYFVWANLAAFLIMVGPIAAAGLVRAVRALPGLGGPRWPAAEHLVPAVLALAGLATVLLADLSGLSKAETERIWLPFGYVVIIAAALLPTVSARAGLTLSVVLTVVAAHLIWTPW
ncbi:hypothetical protein [Microlunatus parietis]|uniref:MFS family permease n=1 Tax=Microlunatus parietis TaxID=682979 RepID=A0A7Y9IC67_9ACTN|nr:hypothetical protein [Microlunatus parietis]NYE73987.1 MFS family permease [Microlunatus parietis]